ncbi:cell division protein ZapE [Paeniglutamicibacter cryotolerans]
MVLDTEQLAALDALANSTLWALGQGHRQDPAGRHLYLWGPPGRGKTWLLGAYFDALPTERKKRMHFHEFFRELHARARDASRAALERLDAGPPSAGPGVIPATGAARAETRSSAIATAIDSLLGDLDVICFDEFHCNDPGDAMLLSRTLKRIFEHRILLVTTSNYSPDQLLPDEYFHHLIEPTIDLINTQMSVLQVAGGTDYRTLAKASDERSGYATGSIIPAGDTGRMIELGLEIPASHEAVTIKPTTKPIAAKRAADGRFWASFEELCEGPTATLDYLAMVEDYTHWVIDGVPAGDAMSPFGLRRFGNVIDVLYDKDLRLDLVVDGELEPALTLLPPADAARLRSRLAALASRLPSVGR